jgi:tetratricopeptide (TPR) repeat protein
MVRVCWLTLRRYLLLALITIAIPAFGQTSLGCYSQTTGQRVPCSNPTPPPAPPSGSLENTQGIAAYEKGDYDRAIQLFVQAYRFLPDPKYKKNEMQARAVKADIQAVNTGARDWDATIHLYEEALNNVRNVPGLPVDAISAQLKRARALRANDIGDQHWTYGNSSAAVQSYTEAVAIDPGSDIAALNLSYARDLGDLDTRLSRTRTRMQQLTFRNGQLNKDMDEWTSLAITARRQAYAKVLDLTTMLGLHFLNEHFQAATPLAANEVARWREVFPSFEGSPLQRAAAEAHAHMMAAKTYGALAEYFKTFGTTTDITAKAGAVTLDPKDLLAWGEFSASVLEIFVHDPLMVAILADVKIFEPTLYGWAVTLTARSVVEDLAKVGVGEYAEASKLTHMYVEDLDARRSKLDTWQREKKLPHALTVTAVPWGLFPLSK